MEKFIYKSAEELNALTADEQTKYVADMKAHEKAVREAELKAKLDPITENQTKTAQDIKDMSETLTQIDAKLKGGAMTAEMKGFLHNVVKENYEDIKAAFKGKDDFKFVVEKVPAMHMTNNGTVSNIAGLTNYPTGSFEVDNDIAFIRVPDNFILSIIRNAQRTKVPEMIVKKQQIAGEGAVAVVIEGEMKPLLQYKFQNTSTLRKKYAGRIEWTEEFEMDFETLLDAIVDMFERDVLTAWQDGLIATITANATTYVSSSLDGTLPNPDNGLAVIATMQQIKALGYTPNAVLMNPRDIDASVFTQDLNGNFSIKPYIDAAGNRINGVSLVPSLKVTAGTALVGDFSIYKEVHTGFIFRRGQYDKQFIENEYTAVGEVFSILNAAPAQYPAIVKVNLATVKAALLKLTV